MPPHSIYADRMDKWENQTSAEALFFHSTTHSTVKGLRVLLPDKGLEFTDGSYIGTDPAGFFYYNDLDEAKTATRYESDTTINPRNNQLCAWVRFYNSANKLISEFLGDDYFNTVQAAGMKGYGKAGNWVTSGADSWVEAHIKKTEGSATLTLDVSKAIKKIATMTTQDPDLKKSGLIDIRGHFHYNDLNSLSRGKYVSYNNDRLVFYENDNTGRTFTGYFIPNGRNDPSKNLLGIKGDKELLLKDTVWSG